MKFSPTACRILNARRFERDMRADGWEPVELPWRFHCGDRWRERAIEVVLSPDGRTIWFKSDGGVLYEMRTRDEANRRTWELSPHTTEQCCGIAYGGYPCGAKYGHLVNGRSFCSQHWVQAFESETSPTNEMGTKAIHMAEVTSQPATTPEAEG